MGINLYIILTKTLFNLWTNFKKFESYKIKDTDLQVNEFVI